MFRPILKTVFEKCRPVMLPNSIRNPSTVAVYDNIQQNSPVLSVVDLKSKKFTNSGIVGLKINRNQAVMVEIGSEQTGNLSMLQMLYLLENVLDACHLFLEKRLFLENYAQILMKQEKLNMLKDKYGMYVASHVKSIEDDVKGIIVPRKAILLNSLMSVQFYGLTLQKDELKEDLSFEFGESAVLLAYKKDFENSMNERDLELILKNICKHILVMNPITIDQQKMKNVARNRCLLQQSYLFDENLSVAKFAALNGIELVDFKRFECNNDSNDANIITPNLIECSSKFFGTLL